MFNSSYKSVNQSETNENSNENSNMSTFGLLSSKSAGSPLGNQHNGSNMRMNANGSSASPPSSFGSDPMTRFENNMMSSSGFKSVKSVDAGASGNAVVGGGMGAFRSLSDGFNGLSTNVRGDGSGLGQSTGSLNDIDLDEPAYSLNGGAHKGIAAARPQLGGALSMSAMRPIGGGLGGLGGLGGMRGGSHAMSMSMDDLDDMGQCGGLGAMASISSFSAKSAMAAFGGASQESELKSVPLKGLGGIKGFPAPQVSMQGPPPKAAKAKQSSVSGMASMPDLPNTFMGNMDIPPMPTFGQEAEDEMMDCFVPPKVLGFGCDASSGDDVPMALSPRKDDGCFVKPDFYNEYTTCTMAECPKDVLIGVKTICDKYGDEKERDERELEYTVEEKDFGIEGTVYVKHKPLRFAISIWHDSEEDKDGLTRVEFQKRRGDSMLFQQFWSEMLELMHLSFSQVSGAVRCQDFESFFMPSFDLEDDYQFTEKDLNNMAMDLQEDYRDEALDVLATLCEEMGKKDFCQLASKHFKLIESLVKNTLGHYDACHVRGGLCALSKMVANSGASCMRHLIEKTNVLNQLASLLKHDSMLIQKRAIELLSQLSSSDSIWKLQDSMCDYIRGNLMNRSHGSNCNEEEMLKNIGNKVDSDRVKQSKA